MDKISQLNGTVGYLSFVSVLLKSISHVMACRFCPGAVHVSLYVDEDGHLLTPLTKLEHLRELKLLGGCVIV
jgi:hypothetical protein